MNIFSWWAHIFVGWILCLICRTVIQLNLSFKTVKETFGTFRISAKIFLETKFIGIFLTFSQKLIFPQ